MRIRYGLLKANFPVDFPLQVKRWILLSLLALTAVLAVGAPAPAAAQSPRERQLAARDHINMGNSLMGQNHFAEAIEEYKKALEMDPTNSVAQDNIVTCHINWGNFFVRQRKYDEAIKEYETCLVLNPHNAKALYNLKIVKQTRARDESAAKARGEAQERRTEAAPTGAQAPAREAQAKKEQPSAVIITPGVKQVQAPATDSSQPEGYEMSSPNSFTGAGESGKQPVQGAVVPQPPVPEARPAVPAAPAAPAAAQPVQPIRAAAPPAHPASSHPPVSSSPAQSAGSLEDLLAAVEVKIYGHKQADLPVLKRLEKLEMDTAGQARQGTIKDRIEFLRRNYGM